MNISSTAALAVYLGFAIACALGADAIAQEPATTTYGDQNPSAPDELDLFSFLVGKWNGTGRTLEDGSYVEWEGATWIGRYVLDGMAIADEFHRTAPDGTPYLGISLRHFDTKQDSWIIEYLNVSDSILHTQVNPQSGSVSQDAGTIVIISDYAQTRIRERFRVVDENHFTYTTDMSRDGGQTWDPVLAEATLTRVD